MSSSSMRNLILEDLSPIAYGEGDDRVLVAMTLASQDGGYSSDGVKLLAMARDEKGLFELLNGRFAVKEYYGRPYVNAYADHDPVTQIPLEECSFNERIIVLDLPMGKALDFKLDENEINNLMNTGSFMKP